MKRPGRLSCMLRVAPMLAAAAAGLGRAKQTIEKDFDDEKSMNALVGTMNASRKEVLVAILRPANIVVFENLGLERPQTRLRLSLDAPAAGGPPPAWQGTMCAGGRPVQVAAYRDAD
ncbi:hypothetical protein ACSUZJ_07710 [Telluria sp. B2]